MNSGGRTVPSRYCPRAIADAHPMAAVRRNTCCGRNMSCRNLPGFDHSPTSAVPATRRNMIPNATRSPGTRRSKSATGVAPKASGENSTRMPHVACRTVDHQMMFSRQNSFRREAHISHLEVPEDFSVFADVVSERLRLEPPQTAVGCECRLDDPEAEDRPQG